MTPRQDRYSGESPDRWHPEHDTVTAWLDAEAPVEEPHKRGNQPKWPGAVKRRSNMGGDQ